MARLPIPGSDDGKWGEILNQYLSVALDADGELRTDTVGRDQLRLNSVTSHAIADESVTSTKLAPGAVTAVSVGLGNVDNTSDADKPVSGATQSALSQKVSGPTSAVDNFVPLFDGLTGKLLKSSSIVQLETGKVGIGTQTPASLLTVEGSGTVLRVSGNANFTNSLTTYSLTVSNTAYFLGNTGFGATPPTAPLHASVKTTTATGSTAIIGDDLAANTGTSRSKLTLGNANGVAELLVGQASDRSILFNWQYNADATQSYGNLETYARNNPLRIGASTLVLQNAGGNIGIQTATPTHTLTLSSVTTGIAHYNTSDMITNYERVRQYWSGNTFNIITEQGGSGLSRPIFVNGGNTSLTVGTTTPSSPGLRIIRSGTGVESLVQITSGGLTASSATQATLRLDPTINQSGTAGYTVLHVEASETALGSGAKLLADFKANGVSKFSISNTGAITSQQAINTQTGTSYTLTLSDAGQVVTLDNASAISVTVPLHATTAYPIGTRIDLLQLGVGQVTVVPSGGVTIRTASGLKFYGQYAGATLLKLATDTWIISGNLTL